MYPSACSPLPSEKVCASTNTHRLWGQALWKKKVWVSVDVDEERSALAEPSAADGALHSVQHVAMRVENAHRQCFA